MSTAFAAVLTGVESALQAAHSTVPVYVNRTRPLGQAERRALLVRIASTRRDPSAPLGASDWQTAIEVECAARANAEQEAGEAADALLATAWAALLSVPLALPSVTDLDAQPEIVWDFDAADTALASATFRLVVRHRTQANSLSPWST